MKFFVAIVALFLSAFLLIEVHGDCPSETDKKIVCYYSNWPAYREGNGKHEIKDIDATKCTHLIYSFAGLNINGEIESLDPWLDIGFDKGFKQIMTLKWQNPCLKIMIALGGWNEGSEKYSLMAESPEKRTRFVDQVLRFVVHHEFDGFDLDWEYPTERGGLPEDRENFSNLLAELSKAFQKRNKLLSAAVGAGIWLAEKAYDVQEMCKHLHFLNVMTYDYQEPTRTSPHSPLHPLTAQSIEFFMARGCPAEKILLGIPTYGRTFTLVDNKVNGYGAPVTGVGKPGPYTLQGGFMGYNEILELMAESKWELFEDSINGTCYAYKDDQWITFDSVKSVGAKVKYIQDMKLGGIFYWALDTDDFRGLNSDTKYPLLSEAQKLLTSRNEL